MDILSAAYSYLSQFSTFIVCTIIVAHFVNTFWPRKKLIINNESLIIITGGCMGIGRQMALEFARKYQPTILIIDRRDDLFDSVRK